MKNILFFGATGILGSNWVKELVKDNKIYANIHKSKKFFKSKNLFKIKLNLNEKKNILSFCKEKKIKIIINCIAITGIELCENNPKISKEVNYLIPLRLGKIAEELNIQIVHISTDMLFDGKYKKKYNEKNKYSPVNEYSIAKVNSEKFLLKYKKSLIIRSNFFGFSNSKNSTITEKLINEKKLKKNSFLWKDIYFTPMYIPILIFFINLLIKRNLNGIYNISSDECISKFNFGKKILKSVIENPRIFPNNFNKKFFTNRPRNMCLSNNKLKNKFPNHKNKLKFNYQKKCFLEDYKKI